MISELLIKDYKLISFIKSKTPTVFLKVVGVCIIVLFKKITSSQTYFYHIPTIEDILYNQVYNQQDYLKFLLHC